MNDVSSPAVQTNLPLKIVIVGHVDHGKSTLAEAVAHAWQWRVGAQAPYWGPEPTEDVAGLHRSLRLDTLRPIPTGGLFLRAEAMHAHLATIGEEHLRAYGGTPLQILWALLDIATIFVLGSGLYLWWKKR